MTRQTDQPAVAPAMQRTRPDMVLLSIMVLVGGGLTTLSIARYMGYNAAFHDLGVMAQSIWSGAQGQPLLHTAPDIGARSRLNVHVELIYFLIAPLYKLWADPRLLLVLQAALFTAGAWPVYRLTLRHTESIAVARRIAIIYLLYPTAQTSVLFDFHGDTLALPLLLFAFDAMDTRSWRTYALLMALVLASKFYAAVPVACVGLYLVVWGDSAQRRAGLLTFATALVYGAVAFFVVRPLFAPTQSHISNISNEAYLSYYFSGIVTNLRATWGDRLLHAVLVFLPVLPIAWRGWRWLLVGSPFALAVLLSTGPGPAYAYFYHHYALVVSFLIMAACMGAGAMAHRPAKNPAKTTPQQQAISNRLQLARLARITMVLVVLFNILLVDTPLNPLFWGAQPGRGVSPWKYGPMARDRVRDHFLDEHVPPGEPLATSRFLAPHLANRETLYLVRYHDDPEVSRLPDILPQVDYVLSDALFDYYLPSEFKGQIAFEREALGIVLQDPNFDVVATRDGLVLFKREASPDERLTHRVETIAPPSPLAPLTNTIGLVESQITPLDSQGRRYRAVFDWVATEHLESDEPETEPENQHGFVAVSRLQGVEHHRIVHLPTYAVLPTTQWPTDQIVRETFEVVLPDDLAPGRYTWTVGWYDIDHPANYATDARSRVPGTREVAVATMVIGEGEERTGSPPRKP